MLRVIIRPLCRLAVFFGFAASLGLSPHAAGAQTLSRFMETHANVLANIVAGPDGALWLLAFQYSDGFVVRIAPEGTITEYPFGGNFGASHTVPDSYPMGSDNLGIVAGPDGAMWFVEEGQGGIGRLTVAGVLTEFKVPWSSTPLAITVGPDGALWFSDARNATIGRVTTAGAFSQYPVPASNPQITSIATGPDGALWYTDIGDALIGRLTMAGVATVFPVPANVAPNAIAAGPDGALWFTDFNGSIGRITTPGTITMYPVPLLPQPDDGIFSPNPEHITLGPDGAMWFTDWASGDIGRISMTGAITQSALRDRLAYQAGDTPIGIAWGADGNLWVTNHDEWLEQFEILRIAQGPTYGPIVAALLPTSRSVVLGTDVTVFAAIVNSGANMVHGCSIQPIFAVPGSFSYQAWNTATGQPAGVPDEAIDIAGGATQNFVLSIKTTSTVALDTLDFGYYCVDTNWAEFITGLNTLLLTVTSTPAPDIVAIAVTPSNDGIVHLPGTHGLGVFSVATVDLGPGDTITANIGNDVASYSDVPVEVALCQTDTQTGQCLTPPAGTATAAIAQNGTASFAAFLTGYEPLPLDPVVNRIFINFFDSKGALRGATSVAVTTE
jgi:streptogramin lyase